MSSVIPFQPNVQSYSHIAWLPDGISFLSGLYPKGGIYRIDAQTGNMTALGLDAFAASSELSRDGRSLYYMRTLPTKAGIAEADVIVERNLVTGTEGEVIRRSCLFNFRLSPDGQYIAAESTNATANARVVLLVPTRGGEARELMRVPSEVKAEDLNSFNLGQRVGVLGWVPDGSLLVEKNPTDRTKARELWIVPMTGESPKTVIGDSNIPANGQISLSPDGRHFVYTITEAAPPVTSEIAVLENFLPKAEKK